MTADRDEAEGAPALITVCCRQQGLRMMVPGADVQQYVRTSHPH